MKFVLLSKLIFLFALTCNADPVYFRHLQVEDGLANNTVYVSFQDSWGFMWFGTKEGLSRFDGTSFKSFNIFPNAADAGNEFVYSIAQGDNKMLFLGTRSGLYEFNPISEKTSILYRTQADEILNVCAGKKGMIYFLVSGELFAYDTKEKEVHNYTDLSGGVLQGKKMAAMTLDRNRDFWLIASDGTVFLLNEEDRTFQLKYEIKNINKSNISSFYIPKDREIFIGTTTGLCVYDRKTNQVSWLLGSNLGEEIFVRDILYRNNKEYWVATERGLYIVDVESGLYKSLRKDDSDPYSISDNAVYSLLEDKDGGVWCGTYFGGINYHHERLNNFRKYFRKKGSTSLSGLAVRELYPDISGQYLWIGTEDAGLNRLDLKTGIVHPVEKFNAIKPFNVHAVVQTEKGLWAGTFQNGLYVLDSHTGETIKHYQQNSGKSGLASDFIITAIRTAKNVLLIGTSRGVYEYDPKNDQFIPFKHFPENLYVFKLLEDKKGRIWAGTIGEGAYSFDPSTGETENFHHHSKSQNSLTHNSVCGIFEDKSGNIWFSTEGGGISKYDPKHKKFTGFTEEHGLPSNMVYVILEDRKDRIWASTSKGLACLSPGEEKWTSFTKDDGLLTNQFNYSSGYMDESGELFFGSVKGLVSFYPDELFKDHEEAPIFITSFQVNGEDLKPNLEKDWRSIPFRDSIYLNHDESSFAIGFSSLDFASPSSLVYEYWLEGADDNKTVISKNRNVYFTKLRPGDYQFHVSVLNRQNGSEEEKVLYIFISPPWWASDIAYTSYFLLIMLILSLSFVFYHKRQQTIRANAMKQIEAKKQSEFYTAKMNFVTNIVHEIRTPLTLIKGPLELISEEMSKTTSRRHYFKLINRNTERLSILTDQLLDFQALESSFEGNNPKVIAVDSTLDSLISEFELLAESNGITIQAKRNVGNASLVIDEEIFHRIVSNLLSNAVKYADKHVFVECTLENSDSDLFVFSIYNDGPLVPLDQKDKIFEAFHRVQNKKEEGTGIGLTLAKILTERNGGTLEYDYFEGVYNRFILKLPLHI